jgi:hypothetical protein
MQIIDVMHDMYIVQQECIHIITEEGGGDFVPPLNPPLSKVTSVRAYTCIVHDVASVVVLPIVVPTADNGRNGPVRG